MGARFAVGLGRKKLKNIEKDIQALLEDEGLYNVGVCKHAVKHYNELQSKFTRTAQLEKVVAKPSGSSDLLKTAIITAINKQRWTRIGVSKAPGKGQCVMAYENIPSCTVVCDYHAKILEWQLGHAKYKNNTSDNNTYMFAVQDGSNRFYLDATDEHCLCHPTTKLKGRLINHSVNGNLLETSPNAKK